MEKTEPEVKAKPQWPELALEMIDKGKAMNECNANLANAARKIKAHVEAGGQKISKARCVVTLKFTLGFDRDKSGNGQYSLLAENEVKLPKPLPRFDFLASTETPKGTPTLSVGAYPGMDNDIDGQEFIDPK